VPVVRGELAFEVDGEAEAKTDHEETELESVQEELPVRGRQFARLAGASGKWTTESNPVVVDRAAGKPGTENIKLSRVSRGKVAEVLPTLISGTAPLRSMMGR
jgi:hypothetical protein